MIPIIKATTKYLLLITMMLPIIACRYEFPTGRLLHYGSCKNSAELDVLKMDLEESTSQQECIHYEYDGVKNLYFTHINADFNCCPEEIIAETEIKGNNIVVEEAGDGMCNCICLYDLEYVISSLEPGIYNLQIDSVDDLELEIDLSESYSGTLCAEREGYPWN